MEQTTNSNTSPQGNSHNLVWSDNQIAICTAMIKLIRENERFPTKTEIAAETGLNVRTVYNHMREFDELNLGAEDFANLKFLTGQVIAKIVELALEGNLHACRLMLQIPSLINKQKN